jgi:spore germination protein GerM
VLALGIVSLSACSVGSEDAANRVAPEDVPFDLLDVSSTSTSIVPSTGSMVVREIYLVRDERLRVVTRPETAVNAANLLSLLAAGPTEQEIAAGVRTAVVPELAQVTDNAGDTVVVDLAAEFSSLAPAEQRMALAQVTYTLTQLPAVSAVRFLVAGQEVSVPSGDGSSVDRPVTPQDYPEVRPL